MGELSVIHSEDFQVESVEDIGEGVIKIYVIVKGIRLKRLWHKSGYYEAAWEDVHQKLQDKDLIDLPESRKIESAFKLFAEKQYQHLIKS